MSKERIRHRLHGGFEAHKPQKCTWCNIHCTQKACLMKLFQVICAVISHFLFHYSPSYISNHAHSGARTKITRNIMLNLSKFMQKAKSHREYLCRSFASRIKWFRRSLLIMVINMVYRISIVSGCKAWRAYRSLK